MEKMISVINDNLRIVISGIKTHRIDTEKSLVTIKADMDDKIAIAQEYKSNVEDARRIISNLESEISELENDLTELNAKFGAKNFKEILAAGNKEINTKIIEKRALINEQSQRILELTEKAHVLKDELVKLKERKIATETNLEKTVTLEKYYDKRITSIIEFSEEHPSELDSFVEEVPQEELSVNTEEFENVDINNVIDGKVFEEIDEISSNTDVTEDLIKEVLVEEDEDVEEIEEEEDDTEDEPIDLSMTQQLDDIILQANNLLEKSAQISEKITNTIEPSIEHKEKENVEEEVREVDATPLEETPEEEVVAENKDDVLNIFVPEETAENKIDPSLVVMPTLDGVINAEDVAEKQEEVEPLKSVLESIEELNIVVDDDDIIDLKIENDDEEESTGSSFQQVVEETPIETTEEKVEVVEDIVPEENDFTVKDDNVIDESIFTNNSNSFYDDLQLCNLDPDQFNEEDLIKLEHVFNRNNTEDFINVMRKHNIGVTKIYKAVNVLINVTPQNLDQIITLLESAGGTPSAIEYVFSYLDKVNINKLEESVAVNKDAELSQILFEAVPYIGESDLIERLDLNQVEEMTLRGNATPEDFKIMNLFPDIVIANYNALKALRIDNLNECLTKHPHRFIFNPDKFAGILDKYDTDDLIRCINKNSAVLDRL